MCPPARSDVGGPGTTLDSDRCPSDPAEVADLYVVGRLDGEAARAFEDHYLTCPRCAEEVQRAQNLKDALTAAVGNLARREESSVTRSPADKRGKRLSTRTAHRRRKISAKKKSESSKSAKK